MLYTPLDGTPTIKNSIVYTGLANRSVVITAGLISGAGVTSVLSQYTCTYNNIL